MHARRRHLVGLAVVLAVAAAMAARTWGTWPDARVDFGSQLYYPWRMGSGQRLYADIAFYNGPLSQYVNAAAFTVCGVGLRTLVWLNLAMFAGVLWAVRSLAGTAAGVVAALVFGFGQYVDIANYNWVCPYTHEVTHGVALGLAAVAAIARWHRDGRGRWLVAAGVALGLCFLTKAEVFAPAAAAVGVGLLLLGHKEPRTEGTPGVSGGRSGPAHFGSTLRARLLPAVFVAALAVGVVAVAFALLSPSLGPATAGRAVAGSWLWVFDRRVSAIPFYRIGAGLDDKAGNLLAMGTWVGIYAAAAVAATLLASRRWRIVGGLATVAAVVAIVVWWPRVVDVARPWPVLVAGILATAVRQSFRGPVADRSTWATRATLATLALGLMAKMVLFTRVYHYGFALALPAAAVLVDAAVNWGPAWVGRRAGFDAGPARAATVGLVAALVAIHLYVSLTRYVDPKTAVVGAGVDAFLATPARGAGTEAAWRAVDALLPRDGTLAVVPQGLMINYLSRRVDPVATVNFMPPELISAGEANVLTSLATHPPDAVILTAEGFDGDAFVLTEGHYRYGRLLVAWFRANYESDPRATLPAGLRLLRRRR